MGVGIGCGCVEVVAWLCGYGAWWVSSCAAHGHALQPAYVHAYAPNSTAYGFVLKACMTIFAKTSNKQQHTTDFRSQRQRLPVGWVPTLPRKRNVSVLRWRVLRSLPLPASSCGSRVRHQHDTFGQRVANVNGRCVSDPVRSSETTSITQASGLSKAGNNNLLRRRISEHTCSTTTSLEKQPNHPSRLLLVVGRGREYEITQATSQSWPRREEGRRNDSNENRGAPKKSKIREGNKNKPEQDHLHSQMLQYRPNQAFPPKQDQPEYTHPRDCGSHLPFVGPAPNTQLSHPLSSSLRTLARPSSSLAGVREPSALA